MNVISDIPFEGSFVWGIVFCFQTHPTNFKIFLNMIFNIMLVSNQSGNITPRLPTCAKTRRHFVEPSSTSSDHHLGKPNKSPTSRRINHHQPRRPTDYTERAYRHRRTVASSSRHRPRHDLHRQGRTITSPS